MTERFDAVIIGTGQAGKPLAGALAEAGWKTAIIERGRVGGTCVIAGCTPTKTMVASARVAHLTRRSAEYGVLTREVSIDMELVRARKRAIVDSFSGGSEEGLRRHPTLELVFGQARFVAPHEVEVRLGEGGTRRMEAPRIFINTGGRPVVPDVSGLRQVPFLDSTTIMELGAVPEHLVVMGGGFIGLEFAQMFRRFGADVTIIERGSQIAGREDPDVAGALAAILVEEGITLRLGATVECVAPTERGGVRLQVVGDGADPIVGSHLLVAVGRVPETDALDLDAAGVERDDRGYVVVSERLETNVPGVYALGDVNGGPPFTHIAYDDYRVIRAHLLDGNDERTTRDRVLPYTVFTDPPLSRIGLTEAQAREQFHAIRVARMPMSRVARAIEVAEMAGMIKVVVDAGSGQILGAAVLGVESGEIAAVLQTAMIGKVPYTVLRDAVFAHPTVAESLNNLFMTLVD